MINLYNLKAIMDKADEDLVKEDGCKNNDKDEHDQGF